jgi:hypothetical protein
MKNTHLVVGGGEVGKAIADVLDCDIIDIDPARSRGELGEGYEFLHICVPYSENFENIVVVYKAKINPRYIIIHSTVPVGLSRKLGAIHSPVRGKHPNLTESVKTFTKYFGGRGAPEVAKEFKGLITVCYEKPETTEALKLCDLLQYAASIIVAKEIAAFCDKMDLDYEQVYTFANHTYNQGYEQMGLSQFIRPVLENMPGKIGGHCVIQNIPKLDIPIVRYIINKNNQL